MNEIWFFLAIGLTFCFAFVNGVHDGGNVVATIIGSRSLRPARALLLATVAEFVGPLVIGTAVANTIALSVVKPESMSQLSSTGLYIMVISAVGGAIAWKLPTWYFGLPSSSSHALISGLVGAGAMGVGISGVAVEPVITSLVAPLLCSPLIGVVLGFLVFSFIRGLFGGAHRSVGRLFQSIQKPIMLLLAASHGSNDAQKSMGIIALVLAARSTNLPVGLHVPHWVMVGCAAALAAGLAAGGLRIVKSVGYDIYRMEPVDSFASQFSATSVILAASLWGGPVSTTQVVGASVMGVGAARRLSGVRWRAARNMAYAWLLTVPVSAALAAGSFWILSHIPVR